jgi:hypothetical protein
MPVQTTILVDANILWQVFRSKNENWLGICEPLKLTIQSDTYADLMEDIGLALDGLLKEMLATNELNSFLRDRGWQLVGAFPNPQQHVRFDVPFVPAMMGANGPQRELHQ